ncbi:MAG: hypothetical protein CMJ46_04875 [Planctomyces sp.]|nr:hypothetical protein [Planctomyces sp.]
MIDPTNGQPPQSSIDTDEIVIYKTVRDIRRAWKPHKQAVVDSGEHENTSIRVHRACSWMHQVENLEQNNHDQRLILLWISFNTLYGTWNPEERAPVPDSTSWGDFLKRILKLDQDGCLRTVLTQHRKLVTALLQDEHLSRYFWQEPTPQRANQSRKAMHESRTWYLQKNWGVILTRVMERIYLARCQLVHGAATCGSELNRTALRRCATMLGHLQPAFLTIIVHHGAKEDWGLMCYPPLRPASGRPS